MEKIYSSFCEAWNMVIDVPLAAEDGGRAAEPHLVAMFIPLAGVICGVLLTALGVLCAWRGGAFLWAFAALIALELVDSGRGSRQVASSIEKFISRSGKAGVLPAAGTLLMIFKLAALYIISRGGNCGYMTVFFVTVFSVEMYLAVLPGRGQLIAVDEEDKKLIGIIPAAVGFFWFWFYPYATVLSAVAAWGIVKVFRKKVWKEGFVPGGDDITLVSGFCEVVLLAAAVLTMGA